MFLCNGSDLLLEPQESHSVYVISRHKLIVASLPTGGWPVRSVVKPGVLCQVGNAMDHPSRLITPSHPVSIGKVAELARVSVIAACLAFEYNTTHLHIHSTSGCYLSMGLHTAQAGDPPWHHPPWVAGSWE